MNNESNAIREFSPKKRYMCFKKIIGKGGFKIVYRAYDKMLGIFVAWNSINLSPLNKKQINCIKDEIKVLVNIKHKNLLSMSRHINFLT